MLQAQGIRCQASSKKLKNGTRCKASSVRYRTLQDFKKHLGGYAGMTDGIMKRLPVKGKDGSIDLIEIEGILYLEAKGHDTLIRTKHFC